MISPIEEKQLNIVQKYCMNLNSLGDQILILLSGPIYFTYCTCIYLYMLSIKIYCFVNNSLTR